MSPIHLAHENRGVGVNHRQHYGVSLTTNRSKKWSEKYEMKPISPNDVEGIISPAILRIADEVRLMFSLDVQ